MSGKRIAAMAAGVAMFLGAEAARAVPITFYFTGVIDYVTDPGGVWSGRLQTGGLFTGSYMFDSDTPPRIVDPGIALYDLINVTAVAGGETITTAGTSAHPYLSVQNLSLDAYSVDSSIYDLDRYDSLSLMLAMRDWTGQFFSDTSLPLLPPELPFFQERLFMLNGYDSELNSFTIRGTITSLVPEPASALLLFLFGSLCFYRR